MEEPTKEQEEQLYRLTERLKDFYPELAKYRIELKYEDLKGDAFGQIGWSLKPGKLDTLQSLKKAKLIFKNYSINSITITFHKKLLNLGGSTRKDVLFYIGSHELTHFLEVPEYLESQELGIEFDSHSQEFYRKHLERYNQFKRSRNEEPVEDIKQFDDIISRVVSQVIEEKKIEGQIITKTWENENVKK